VPVHPLHALLVLAVLLAAGCASPGATPPERVLTLGAILPHTGPLERVGPLMQRAIEAAAAHANDHAASTGWRVRVLHEDSQTNPTTALAAFHRLRAAGAQAFIGEVASPITLALAEAAQSSRVLLVSPGSSTPELTNRSLALAEEERWVLRTVPSDALRGKVAASYAHAANWSRVALLYEDTAYGRGFRSAFQPAFEAPGKELRLVPFAPGQAAYASALEQAFGPCGGTLGCPDAVVVVALSAEAKLLAKEWWERPHWRGVPWFFAEAEQGTFDALVAQGVRFPAGLVGTAHVGTGPGWDAFHDAHPDLPPFAAPAYDAVLLLALAAIEAGSAEPGEVRKALRRVASPPGEPVGPRDVPGAAALLRGGRDLDYEGASGGANLDAAGDVTSAYELFRLGPQGGMDRLCVIPEEDVLRAPVPLPAACHAT
jgi:branched-chain amino acid transport system substrate-binding protein